MNIGNISHIYGYTKIFVQQKQELKAEDYDTGFYEPPEIFNKIVSACSVLRLSLPNKIK